MFKAKVYVTYKPSVLDPKAEVIKTALTRMDYHNVDDVLYGKYFELKLTGTKEAVEKQVDTICDQLLANVNMETYRFELEPSTGDEAGKRPLFLFPDLIVTWIYSGPFRPLPVLSAS